MNDTAEYDFISVGSGGGGLCAALFAASAGKKALVLEKLGQVGGSTSMSGGVLWIPDSRTAERAGAEDSFEEAMTYMDAVVGDAGPASSLARRRAFIKEGSAAIDFLEQEGIPFYFCDGYSDYYDEMPGGKSRGRVLAAEMLDSRSLGDWYPKLQQFAAWAGLPVHTEEFHKLGLAKITWLGRLTALKVGLRFVRQAIFRQHLLCRGAALQGRILNALRARGVEIRLESPVTDLVVENNHVVGVKVTKSSGETETIRSRSGVLIDTGGFARNEAMRKKYQPQPSSTKWTAVNPGDTGDLLEPMMRLGAATAFLDEAIWIPASFTPDGTLVGFHNPHDLAKPFSILVDGRGKRFVNEAASYMEVGQAMYQAGAVPAWAILDSRHRKRYPWGSAPPGRTPKEWIASGYMLKADSIADLARQMQLDADDLTSSIVRFNKDAASGKDSDFNRGARYYDRYNADPSHSPNPTLGTIEQPPFYAVKIWPGDVGTFGGVMTEEHGAVVRENGSVIPGLYATGNGTASVMGRTYPGAGASIAASFAFGFAAVKHALDKGNTFNKDPERELSESAITVPD